MYESVYWLVEVDISPEILMQFRDLADEIVAASQAETGCFAYECHFSDDNTSCRIFEGFTDSPSVITHVANFGEKFAERFMSLCSIERITLMGNPNDAVKETMAGFSPTIFERKLGFNPF